MKKYCPRCGVELEPSQSHCPLCGTLAVSEGAAVPPSTQAFPGVAEELRSRVDQILHWRGRILLVISLILLIPVGVCIWLDYLYTGMTWSYWVVYSLALTWGLIFMFLAFLRTPLVMFLCDMLCIGGFLWSIDMVDHAMDWSLSLALPILLWISLGGFLVWLGNHWFKSRPGYLVGVLMGGLQIICFGVDLSLRAWMSMPGHPGWSLVVLSALGPIGGISVLLQVLFNRSVTFRRFFHW